MSALLKNIRATLLGIGPEEAGFERRGFPPARPHARNRLESIASAFIEGYRLAIQDVPLYCLAESLDGFVAELRGFGYEGAGVALTLLDGLGFNGDRFARFVAGPAADHVYLACVGAGWACARLPWRRWRVEHAIRAMSPHRKWLTIDGFGFHEGYFHWRGAICDRRLPRRLGGYGLRAFDQGLGRSIWFCDAADPSRVAATIARFPQERRSDLWSGAGSACCYAGGCTGREVYELFSLAGEWRAHMAQGAIFAATARSRAAKLTGHTEMACPILTVLTAAKASQLAAEALSQSGHAEPDMIYERWRARIRIASNRNIFFARQRRPEQSL
jgi:hypothetical protein